MALYQDDKTFVKQNPTAQLYSWEFVGNLREIREEIQTTIMCFKVIRTRAEWNGPSLLEKTLFSPLVKLKTEGSVLQPMALFSKDLNDLLWNTLDFLSRLLLITVIIIRFANKEQWFMDEEFICWQ